MSELTSAALPPVDRGEHVRDSGPEVVAYMDLACPQCALAWLRIRDLPVRVCVRHFPLVAKRPRAGVLHAATEAAALQSEAAFWSFWDSLYEDRAHHDDPHLWQRAERFGLDLARFEHDRRSEAVAARIRADFHGGIRAGVSGAPRVFLAGEPLAGPDPAAELARRVAEGARGCGPLDL